jgi:hypothetical protein
MLNFKNVVKWKRFNVSFMLKFSKCMSELILTTKAKI